MDQISQHHGLFRQASNPDTDAERLALLATSDSEWIRAAVLMNLSAPDTVVHDLSNDASDYVRSCLRMRSAPAPRFFAKPHKVFGRTLAFRNADMGDARFILQLRTDPVKSRFLSRTSEDLKLQIAWLEEYRQDRSQLYFIIEDLDGERYGTVRLYDIIGDSFCWGSWILTDGCPSGFAVESALMVYHYALRMGFRRAHFDVRKGNESVWQFHERFGAVRTAESDEDWPFVVSCGSQQSESLVVVEPGGHVGRLPLSLSTCPRGGCREHGFERWN